jgi:DNA-binding response OmpR family regulator
MLVMCKSKDKTNVKQSTNLKHIFIVEDEPDLQNLYSIYLKQDNWIVDQALDGFEAIKKYERYNGTDRPYIILIDINLPSCSGIEVANKILDINPEQQIIFVSANLDLLWDNPKLVKFPKMRKPISLHKLSKRLNNLYKECSLTKKAIRG